MALLYWFHTASLGVLRGVRRLRRVSLRAKILLLFLIPALALVLNLLIVGNISVMSVRTVDQMARAGLGKQLVAVELDLNAQALEAAFHRFLRRGDPADLAQFRSRVQRFRRYLAQYEALAEDDEERMWVARLHDEIARTERLAEETVELRRRQDETQKALEETFRDVSQTLESFLPEKPTDPAHIRLLLTLDRDIHETVLAAMAYADNPTADRRAAFEQASTAVEDDLKRLREAGFQQENQVWFEQLEDQLAILKRLEQELVQEADAEEQIITDLQQTTGRIEGVVRNQVRVKAARDAERLQEVLEQSLTRVQRGGVLISVVAILVGLLVSGLLVWQLHTSVGHIVETLERIEAGDLSQRIRLTTEDELGQIARTFNRMMGEIVRQRVELERWGHMLEARVAERTEELRRALEDLDILYNVAVKLTSVRDMKQLVQAVYEEIKRLMDIDVFYLALYDEATGTVRVESYIERGQELGPFIFPLAEAGLAGWIIQTGETLFVRDVDEEWDRLPVRPRQIGEPSPHHSYLGVPLKVYGRIIGVLSVQRGWYFRLLQERERRLVEALAGQVAVAVENARLYQALLEAARTDPLTGLSNRRHFEQVLQQEVTRARRYNRPLALVVVDLDGLKQINDTLGHQCGDRVLQAVAALLRDVARETDIVSRWGGDEFALLLPETGKEGARHFVRRLYREAARRRVECNGKHEEIAFSAGAATLDPDDESGEALLRAADAAMYEEKRRRRGLTS